MSFEDNDNYYVIEEEKDIDTSPRNFASYTDEEREQEKEESGEDTSISPIKLLFKVMFNPVEGWKSIRRSNYSEEVFQSRCFYPMLALLAVSKFAEFFYSVNVSLSRIVTEAVVEFVAFFFTYFCIPTVLSWVVSEEATEKINTRFGKEYYLIGLTTLAMFSIIINLLPMIWPILIFLPIWTLYLMFKGIRFFHLTENREMRFYVLSSAAVIGLPLLIEWGLTSILPY